MTKKRKPRMLSDEEEARVQRGIAADPENRNGPQKISTAQGRSPKSSPNSPPAVADAARRKSR